MSVIDTIKLYASAKPPTCSAVIAAAGSSLRCRGEDKLLYEINGKPLLAYTVDAFEKCEHISEIIVTVKSEQLSVISQMLSRYGYSKLTKVITGGSTRMDSVYNGVFAASPKSKLIAIHDGARPCINTRLIEKIIMTAAKHHAAAPGVSVVPTIKRTAKPAGNSRDMIISETIDRDTLVEIQTPQIFNAKIIKAGLTKAADESILLTDDCMAVELLGVPVYIAEGSRENIKVTQPVDLKLAGYLLSERNQ